MADDFFGDSYFGDFFGSGYFGPEGATNPNAMVANLSGAGGLSATLSQADTAARDGGGRRRSSARAITSIEYQQLVAARQGVPQEIPKVAVQNDDDEAIMVLLMAA